MRNVKSQNSTNFIWNSYKSQIQCWLPISLYCFLCYTAVLMRSLTLPGGTVHVDSWQTANNSADSQRYHQARSAGCIRQRLRLYIIGSTYIHYIIHTYLCMYITKIPQTWLKIITKNEHADSFLSSLKFIYYVARE